MDPKQKQHPAVDVTSDGSKVQSCNEQYCIGTRNVRFMNQGKLEVVKQEMARVNADVLGIRQPNWSRTQLSRTQLSDFDFSLSCTGEGNGNPLQCSCLENPRDRRAWWAAVYGVVQSQT